MLLSDGDIVARLEDIGIVASNPNFPFQQDHQVQPCSIDLRLSEVAWRPRRFRSIDLSDNTPLGPKITHAFERVRLSFPKGYLLRPGKSILCRTYESFKIPTDLCGRLVGRSSLGRLGLAVATSANFINPGWSGHMPVVIVNEGPFSVRIQPYLSLVQLLLFQLSSPTKNPYGSAALGSKYINDEGGPSRYWLDRTINALRENLNLRHSSARAERFLERYSQELDDQTRERFVKRLGKFGHVDDPLDFTNAFASSEGARQALVIVLGIVVSVPIATLVAWLPSFLLGGLIGAIVAAFLGFLVLFLCWWLYRTQFRTSFSGAELRKIAAGLKKEGL